MNFTSIGNTQNNLPIWKRIKTQYVVTTAALALAASAAFAFSPSTSHKTAALTGGTAPVAASLASPQAADLQVIYIVGSAPEGEALNQEGKQYIVDGSTPDQFQAPDAVRELMSNNPSFVFADLRARVAPSPEQERDIFSGVISTERATWGAPEGVFQPSHASDADIMAGIISNERALYVFTE